MTRRSSAAVARSSGLTRRDLVRLAALGLGTAACRVLNPICPPRSDDDEPYLIVVLGGGLAGLAALHVLESRGYEVLLLEARGRPGGRVLTLRAPFEHGQHAEAGATFVPAEHELTRRYASELGLELVPAAPSDFERAFFLRGQLLFGGLRSEPDWPFALTPEEREAGLFELYGRYVYRDLDALVDPREPDFEDDRVRHLDALSFADLLRENGASPAAVELLSSGYFSIVGDGPETVSALSVLQDLALQGGFESSRVAGGSDRLPALLAERHRASIRYGIEVVALEQDAQRVRVHARSGAEPLTIEAARVVCTLPLPVLRGLRATPEWSAAKRAALGEVGETAVTRVFLQARRRFWQRERPVLSIVTDRALQVLEDSTLTQDGPAGIVEAYTTGANARELGQKDDAARRAFVAHELEALFPGGSGEITGGTSYAWHLDPHARGGYAWFRPGQVGRHRAALGASEGRVHFAGEHTSAYTGWMQGALESGERAAREILEPAGAEARAG